jgi:hypothetical protein
MEKPIINPENIWGGYKLAYNKNDKKPIFLSL